jgi:hypothetical protein
MAAMDSLARTFSEDPTYVYVALGAVALVCGVVWYERRRPGLLLGVLAAAALAGGVFLAERLIVTDREQILRALDEIADAVEREDIDAVGTYLDDNFGGWRASKSIALAAAKVAVARYQVGKVQYWGDREITISGPERAECKFRTLIHYGGRNRVLLEWKLTWIKRPQGWRIRRASTPRQPDNVLP